MISLRFCGFSIEALEKNMVLSTNCKRDTLVLFLPTTKPFDKSLSFALIIILLRTSIAMVNEWGKRISLS